VHSVNLRNGQAETMSSRLLHKFVKIVLNRLRYDEGS